MEFEVYETKIKEVRQRFHDQMVEALSSKTELERSKLPLLHDVWRVPLECNANEVYLYEDYLYRCLQSHSTQEGWEPDKVPALFAQIAYRDGYRIIPEIITVGTVFNKDECGWWNNILYKSVIDANAYTPEQYPAGWEIVVEGGEK